MEKDHSPELEALIVQSKRNSEEEQQILETLVVQGEKNNKEVKEALKETGDKIKESVEDAIEDVRETNSSVMETLAKALSSISMAKGEKGEKGDKPVAGVDYEIPKDGKTPVKGEDYFTKEEVSEFLEKATPKKNKDYFDGKDGRDGKDADEQSIIQKVLAKTRQPKDGKDGRDGKDGKDGSPDTGKEIVKKLESLEEKDKLSYSAIKDAPDYLSMMRKVSSKDYAFLELTDTPESYSGQAGKTLAVNGTGTGLEFVTNVATDEKVGVSATDTTPDYLGAKVSAGTGITLATLNGAANELLQVNVTLSPFSTDDLSEGSNLYFTNERAQDAVGTILTDTSTIDFTYNDAGNLITADVIEAGLTLNNIGGTLGVSKGGTGTATTFTQGSVVFAGASGVYTQDNSNFFWDDTNNRLGIGTTSPSVALHVKGTGNVANFEGYSTTAATSPGVFSRRGRGTPASPAGVVSGDQLGGFFAAGMTDVLAFPGNSIAFIGYAAETFTTSARGAYAQLEVTPTGGTTRSAAMTWLGNKNVGINTSVPTGQLHITVSTASTIGARITGASSQSANYLTVEDSTSAEMASIRVRSASTRGARFVSRASGGTEVSFEAYEPVNGYPRAQFIIGDTSISNAGMSITPSIDARDIFLEASTYSDVTNSSAHRLFVKSNVSGGGYGSIHTGKGSSGDGGALYIGTTQTGTNGAIKIEKVTQGQAVSFRGDYIANEGGEFQNVTTVNAATYDLLITDRILHVTYTTTGAVTSLTLPSAQTTVGRVVTIKDAGGNASINNITIDTQASQTIDGSASISIVTNYASITIYSDGSNWFMI